MENKKYENDFTEEIAHLKKESALDNIDIAECDHTEARNIEPITPIKQYVIEVDSPVAVPEKRCYTVEDVQAMLCISRPSVYKLIAENHFHTVKVAGKHRISKKSFDKWFDSVE